MKTINWIFFFVAAIILASYGFWPLLAGVLMSWCAYDLHS